MKRHAPPRGIKPVIAPFAVENEYRIEMDVLIRAMAQDIHREVMAIYRPWLEMQRAAIVGDASVVDLLVGAFNRLRAKWSRRAGPMAEKRAPVFVSKVNDTVAVSFTRMLRSVSVDPKDVPKANRLQGKAMEVTLDAAVAENVALIKSIPTEYIDSVQRDVLLAVQGGWPLGQLSDMLKKCYGITRRRAELIARDQCAKVTGRMNQQRSLAAGFTEADWWHSAGSRYPRKLHMKANGKRFKLAEGCEIGGEHILCGQKINCKCFFTVVVPGRS